MFVWISCAECGRLTIEFGGRIACAWCGSDEAATPAWAAQLRGVDEALGEAGDEPADLDLVQAAEGE